MNSWKDGIANTGTSIKTTLDTIVVIVWVVIVAYATYQPVLWRDEHIQFFVFDVSVHVIMIFVASMTVLPPNRRARLVTYWLINAYSLTFYVTLLAFDGKFALADFLVLAGVLLFAVLAGRIVYKNQLGST